MERIKELLEELRALVSEEYPDYTIASLTVHSDGYVDVSVVQWDADEEKPTSVRKRKELFDQHRRSGSDEWIDQAERMNEYYGRLGCLLGGEK